MEVRNPDGTVWMVWMERVILGENKALHRSMTRCLFPLGPSSQHGAGAEPRALGEVCVQPRVGSRPRCHSHVSMGGGWRRWHLRPLLSSGQNAAAPSGTA